MPHLQAGPHNRILMKTAGPLILTALLLLLGVASLLTGRALAAGRLAPQASGGIEWVFDGGTWYCRQNGSLLSGQWIEDGTYFIDENGRMAKDEWVCEKLSAPGEYLHGHALSAAALSEADLTRLTYVGQDGRRIRNKTIYFSPLRFDSEGLCNLTDYDLAGFTQAKECGLEGFRRYVIFHGGYKEYY